MASRVGIFGGTFEPFHYGHLNSLLEVAEHFGLDQIKVVPSFISPLRGQTQGSTPEQRAEMTRLGLAGHEDLLQLDKREIERAGISYTIDTLNSYIEDGEPSNFFLIIGMDQFVKFDQWKDFEKILANADMIVTSRPGAELPHTLEDWPAGTRGLVSDFDSHQALLKSGHTVYFYQLKDVDVSATEIRRKIRLGQGIHGLVPPPVEKYIRQHKLYESVQQNIGDYEKFAHFCEGVLQEKGAINVQIYDLRDRPAASEYALICSGTSTRHASALAEHVTREVKKEYGVWPEGLEGQSEGRWVVADYGALIVHVFYDFVRQEYRLEELWTKRAPK